MVKALATAADSGETASATCERDAREAGELRAELVALAGELREHAEIARAHANLRYIAEVNSAGDGMEPLLRRMLERMREALAVLGGYKRSLAGARMNFVWRIRAYGLERTIPGTRATVETATANARDIVSEMVTMYPILADRLRQPDRIKKIADAIVAAGTNWPDVPFKQIRAAWAGVETRDVKPLTWDREYRRHRRPTK